MKTNYFHFGVLEAIGTFADQLAEKTNTQPHKLWVNKTKTKGQYDLTDQDTALLNQLLDTDIALYTQTKDYVMASQRGLN